MPFYEIVEQSGALNTAIAAGATEQLAIAPTKAPYFNFLIVQNYDPAVDTEVLLDCGDVRAAAVAQGKIFRAQFNGGVVNIGPEDGIHFKQVVARNPHATTAQTVSTIIYQWGYKKRIG